MYRLVVGTWGVSPDVFWRLDPRGDLWWLVEAKMPPKMYGSMRESDVATLHEELVEMGYLRG